MDSWSVWLLHPGYVRGLTCWSDLRAKESLRIDHRLHVNLQSPEKVSWRSVRRFSHKSSIEMWLVILHHHNENIFLHWFIHHTSNIICWFNRNPCQYESGNWSLSSKECHDPVRRGITRRWSNIRLGKFLDDMIADISNSYDTMDIYIYILYTYVPWVHYMLMSYLLKLHV